MARKLNLLSRKKIMQWENGGDGSPKLQAYRDSGGVWTIGTGHTGKVNGKPITKNTRISVEEAEMLFEDDTNWACAAIQRLVKVPLSDNQFGALVAWVLNIGEGNAASSTLIRKLNAGDYEAVPHELMKWVKDRDPKTGKMVTVRGLVNRRAAEVGLWSTGEHVASAINPSATKQVMPAVQEPATRDVAAHAATGGLGAIAVGAQPVSDAIETIVSQQYELSSGDIVRMLIAAVIVIGTLYVIWRKFKSPSEVLYDAPIVPRGI